MGAHIAPIFATKLTNSLIPENYTGSGTPTFTRATTAYQTDFEGKLNAVLSGEARFQGARRVRNLVVKSEDFNGWTAKNTVTITSGFTDPLGGADARRIVGGGADSYLYQDVSTYSGAVLRLAVYLKADSPQTINIGIGTTYTSINITTSWQRFALPLFTASAAGNRFIIGGVSSFGAVTIYSFGATYEDVTGQTNQNPSEYVSVGVLSAPWHGAGVDGVKYFTTLNGNTVASNVVTEATGAAINSSQAAAAGGVTAGVVDANGPLGYLAEGARTNLALQSNAFTTTWNSTNHATPAAAAYTAPDGTATMWSLTAGAGNFSHTIYQQGITQTTGTVYTLSFYVRYVNHRWIALHFGDGVTNFYASFDLLNGIAGAVTASTTSTITPTALANVYRVTMTMTSTNSSANATIEIALNNADSASNVTWNAAGTEVVGIFGAQLEAAAFASSYIPTTTVAVQRNADVLTYPSAGNYNPTGAMYAEFAPYAYGTGGDAGVGGVLAIAKTAGSQTEEICLEVYNRVGYWEVTTGGVAQSSTNTGAVTLNASNKMAISYGQNSNITNVLNGTVEATLTGKSATSDVTMIRIGLDALTRPLCGTIRNVRIFSRALSASQLTAMTTP